MEAEWEQVRQVMREICLLYHELAEYSYIMGDLSYSFLPYWEHLDLRQLDPPERAFVRDGCLVMLLAMAWCEIDGAGRVIHPDGDRVRAALERVSETDEDTRQLVRTVQLAVDVASRGEDAPDELVRLSAWVHRRYVQGYFRERVQQFDRHPHFRVADAEPAGGGGNGP